LYEAHRWFGEIKFEERDLKGAIDSYTEAIKLDSTGYQAIESRGNCFKELGQKEKACADFRKAADLGDLRMYDVIKKYCN
jgi:TolA-binding protein